MIIYNILITPTLSDDIRDNLSVIVFEQNSDAERCFQKVKKLADIELLTRRLSGFET